MAADPPRRKPGCPGVTRCRALCGHRQYIETYWTARQADVDEMERVTGMWPGDVEIYKAEHTMITFKRWLLGH